MKVGDIVTLKPSPRATTDPWEVVEVSDKVVLLKRHNWGFPDENYYALFDIELSDEMTHRATNLRTKAPTIEQLAKVVRKKTDRAIERVEKELEMLKNRREAV